MTKQDKTLPADPPADDSGIRCPRLGHQINFSYCRSENYGLPCFKTLDCWHPYFDVHTYLQKTMNEDEFQKVFLSTTKPKVISLVDLIEQAKKDRGTT